MGREREKKRAKFWAVGRWGVRRRVRWRVRWRVGRFQELAKVGIGRSRVIQSGPQPDSTHVVDTKNKIRNICVVRFVINSTRH